jgi:hypothetical protein
LLSTLRRSSAPRLDAVCSHGTLADCPISATLSFAVSGGGAAGQLSAYAEPLDGQGERVWYFSSDTRTAELAGQAGETRAFNRAVRLAGTHRPGRYRIHAFLADRALTPAEMLAGPPSGAVQISLRRELFVAE